MALMAAEVLGIPFEHIHPQVAATDSVGHTDVTGGSRTTLATGQAVIQAAEQCVAEMCRVLRFTDAYQTRTQAFQRSKLRQAV